MTWYSIGVLGPIGHPVLYDKSKDDIFPDNAVTFSTGTGAQVPESTGCESTEPYKTGAICSWVAGVTDESVLTLCDAKTVFARFMASFLNESGTFGDWTAINNCNTNAMSVFI